MNNSNPNQTNDPSKESYPYEKRNLIVFALNQPCDAFRLDVQIRVRGHSSVYRHLYVVWNHPWVATAHSTNRTEPAPILGCATHRSNAEKTGVLRYHRVRFCHPVVCSVRDIKLNRLVGKYHRATFLVLCTLHWLAVGCHHLANGTLQGKLISPEKRGRLLAYSNIIGCTLAIGLAFYLLPRWLLIAMHIMQCSSVQQLSPSVSPPRSVSGLKNFPHRHKAPHHFSSSSVMPSSY